MLSAIRRGVDLGDLDLFDLQMDLLADLFLEHLAQALDVGALLADDDARLRGVQRDVDLVGRALQLDAGDARPRQLVQDQPPDAQILMQLLGVVPLRDTTSIPSR